MALQMWRQLLLLSLAVLAAGTADEGAAAPGVSLVAVRQRVERSFLSGTSRRKEGETKHACVALNNAGTHFTVDVEVGTPGQKFSVVADTGSNSLIVPSCICEQRGACSKSGRCFQGTNRSSTFGLYKRESTGEPVQVLLTFGSGQIQGVIAKDTVSVGGLKTFMEDGLLLMVDQALNIPGPFEGILGLGLPQSELGAQTAGEADAPSSDSAGRTLDPSAGSVPGGQAGYADEVIRKILERIMGGQGAAGGGNGDAIGDIIRGAGGHGGAAAGGSPGLPGLFGQPAGAVDVKKAIAQALGLQPRARTLNATSPKAPQVRSFLEQANIPRFSMCFNDGGSGVLQLGTPEVATALGSVGRAHWGLDFRGISVGGSEVAPLKFCSREDMEEGQETPCGAIPDSGTTMIMGPSEQVDLLLEGVCDNWPRCVANHTALKKAAEAATNAAASIYGFDPWQIQATSKSKVLQFLLQDCESWIHEKGLDELPPLHFHLAGQGGAGGKAQTLELRGVDYVFEQEVRENDWMQALENLTHNASNMSGLTGNSKKMKVCSPAFSTMEYPTKLNGPVWILGLPLFYAYTVAYDTQAVPPSVAFTSVHEVPCGSCSREVGFVSTHRETGTGGSAVRKSPRRLHGPPRMPSIDVQQPL